MTIAAGIKYRNGILLCADTEVTGWAMTLHSSKVMSFKCSAGTFAIACAGNRHFAFSAMQKCRRQIEAARPDEAYAVLERVLDREYRKHVLSHPSQAVDNSLHYWLLIAVHWASEGGLHLYTTQQTSLREVAAYECIGIGDALAHHIIQPMFSLDMQEREALMLATVMLASVKDYVVGCGGLSQFSFIRVDGSLSALDSGVGLGLPPLTNIEWLEKHAKGYDYLSRKLLFKIPNPDLNDSEFEANLGIFCDELRKMRASWRKSAFVHDSMKSLLGGQPKTVNLEDAINPQRPLGDPKSPPPSPE